MTIYTNYGSKTGTRLIKDNTIGIILSNNAHQSETYAQIQSVKHEYLQRLFFQRAGKYQAAHSLTIYYN